MVSMDSSQCPLSKNGAPLCELTHDQFVGNIRSDLDIDVLYHPRHPNVYPNEFIAFSFCGGLGFSSSSRSTYLRFGMILAIHIPVFDATEIPLLAMAAH
jgi:hypothetical protein